MLEEIVYLGADNAIELALLSAEADALPVVINHSIITRCQVQVGATLLDSNTTPALFDITSSTQITLLFGASTLPVGRNLATIKIFDAAHTDGIVWGQIFITVK